jgi:hypothetical protein
MNIQMKEVHGIGIRDITSPTNNEFHEEQTWVCLDIVDETCAPSPWHLIHSDDILGARMLWKPKEARIFKKIIDQPV